MQCASTPIDIMLFYFAKNVHDVACNISVVDTQYNLEVVCDVACDVALCVPTLSLVCLPLAARPLQPCHIQPSYQRVDPGDSKAEQ